VRIITDGTVAGNFPNVSNRYCACVATQSRNRSSWTWALDRIRPDSLHAPGVSLLWGPPLPNLRSHSASTAARMSS
jgi:hypothetical protein